MHFWLHHVAHCTEKFLRAGTQVLCQQNRWTSGGGWGHPQSAVHMVAARLGCERAVVGTGWATSHPDCTNRLRKHYYHLVEGWFMARKATCLGSETTKIVLTIVCSLMNGLIKAGSGSVLEPELGQK